MNINKALLNIVKEIIKDFNETELDIKQISGGNNNYIFRTDKYIVRLNEVNNKRYSAINFEYQTHYNNLLLEAGVNTPKIIHSGIHKGYHYQIQHRVEGVSLISQWFNFDLKTQHQFVAQICTELKKIHSISFNKFSIPIFEQNYSKNMLIAFTDRIAFERFEKLKLWPYEKQTLIQAKIFWHENKNELETLKDPVLVHNDLTWRNIMFKDQKITGIIDLDLICQAPKHYELYRMIDFFYDPSLYLRNEIDSMLPSRSMIRVAKSLQEEYSELFNSKKLATYLRLYYLQNYTSTMVYHIKNNTAERRQWGQKMFDIYQSDWLEQILD
jgi:aminoglycoside phosphotransferase (APT) family kinase protein